LSLSAPGATRSRIAGMERARPLRRSFGISCLRAGTGASERPTSSSAVCPRKASTPYASMASKVTPSLPGAPSFFLASAYASRSVSSLQTWTYNPQNFQDVSAFALTYILRLRSCKSDDWRATLVPYILANVQPLLTDQGPIGHPRSIPREARPHGKSASLPVHLSRPTRADCSRQPRRRARACHRAFGHAESPPALRRADYKHSKNLEAMTMIASRSRRSRVAIAVWALLQSRAAAETPAAPSVSTLHEGYRRYQAVCAHCHGRDGAGSTFPPPLVDRPLD